MEKCDLSLIILVSRNLVKIFQSTALIFSKAGRYTRYLFAVQSKNWITVHAEIIQRYFLYEIYVSTNASNIYDEKINSDTNVSK